MTLAKVLDLTRRLEDEGQDEHDMRIEAALDEAEADEARSER